MTRRTTTVVAGLACLGVLALTSRHDAEWLFARMGSARLAAGDVDGAKAAFARATALGGESGRFAYNVGVASYVRGDYEAAQQAFTAAVAADGFGFAASAHYNRGNALFRLGAERAAGDPGAAARQLREAVADYRATLTLAPDAADAADNLALASRQLALLEQRNAAANKPDSAKTSAAKTGPADGPARPGESATRPPSTATADARSAGAGAAPPGATDRDVPTARRASAPELARDDVERMLSEARRRELPAGSPLRKQRNDAPPGPERDW